MIIKHGLISCDSHVQLDRDNYTSRMSKKKWGDLIPQLVERSEDERLVHRWSVYGKVLRRSSARSGSACNCPAAMDGWPDRIIYPQRWDDVPDKVYVPQQRLGALDRDGVDGEVLFPNDPGWFYDYGDADFELACVRAYNDGLAEWSRVSDRYIGLAMVPYLSGMKTAVAEVERAIGNGHRGILMLAEPSLTLEGLRHISDPYWDPLWNACESLGVPVNVHASGGLSDRLSYPRWNGYSAKQWHAAITTPLGAWPAQIIPNLVFSGILQRHRRLKWVFAEAGIGTVVYVRRACDHEWERRQLWKEGLTVRPTELLWEQVYINFWFEKIGIQMRHEIGVNNIMWESDYPHVASPYPDSWKLVEHTVDGVPDEERKKLLWANAVNLYGLA
jgi:predicted TIM-barrel fold metal-dependent hydrolase